ncbi:hypothetical protein clem_12680 [Legionella clemsonensis]|uniref:Uncharacterized protein n=1 Tax=Legionella clemsonensis TaxID=1867846 RepID=A0A222P5E3_9GAMM|nr:hypothetical protein clem_12680 [Legionella clemsonensis]
MSKVPPDLGKTHNFLSLYTTLLVDDLGKTQKKIYL